MKQVRCKTAMRTHNIRNQIIPGQIYDVKQAYGPGYIILINDWYLPVLAHHFEDYNKLKV
jgi:hypothetical protein